MYTQHKALAHAVSDDDPVRQFSGIVSVLWVAHESGRSESQEGNIVVFRSYFEIFFSMEMSMKRLNLHSSPSLCFLTLPAALCS